MKIGNQMQNHKIETNSELLYEDGSIWSTLIFYQNYRQRYTVIPITTVRGPFTTAYLFWYKYKSNNANFDDMGCTWNAGHVIGIIS